MNQLTEIDLSDFSALQYLDCSVNYLTHINLSMCSGLTDFYCNATTLRSIDVSGNPKLEIFDCRSNDITFLDLSNNPELKTLYSYGNGFMNLRITSSDNESDNETYPFMTDLKEYAADMYAGIKSVMAYDIDSNAVNTSFTPSERYAYFASRPVSIVYVLDNGYTGSAPESDVPRTMNITIGVSPNVLIVPNVGLGEEGSDEHKTFRWDTNIAFTQGLLDALCESFSGIKTSDIYTFNGIISSDTWTLTSDDSKFLAGSDKKFLFALPVTQAKTDGVYVLKCTLGESVKSGDKISVYDMRGHDSEIADYIFIDESYAITDSVPENKNLYLAVKLSAGITNRQAVTSDLNSAAHRTVSSGGGGCDSLLGTAAMIFIMFMNKRIRKFSVISALIIILTASCSYGNVKPSDYALPIDYSIYDIAGTWTTDFSLSSELVDAVVKKWEHGLKPENVHSYSEIALPGTWEVSPADYYNLAVAGLYGAVILPMTESGTGNDVYVLMCTFSNDVQPGEQVSISASKVDTSARESVYDDEGLSSVAKFVMLDENLNPVSVVPESRRVYIAVSLLPKGIANTGIISVIRGEYVKESDPLSRLDPDLAKFIADQLGIPVEELNFINQDALGEPEEATPVMRQYVKDDRHEIISGINMLSVDKDGWYVFQVTLSDDVFEQVRDKDVKNFKFYGLTDSESEFISGDVKSSFVIGLLNTWELFSLTGEKMEVFSLKTFLFAGLMNAGTPFTVYLGKLLLMLLAGCDTGLTPSLISFLILGVIILRSHRR